MGTQNVIALIRRQVLQVTQEAMAEIAGVTQSTVSRWEAGEQEPDRTEMGRIRAAVIKAGKPWDDRWFFEPPKAKELATG